MDSGHFTAVLLLLIYYADIMFVYLSWIFNAGLVPAVFLHCYTGPFYLNETI